MTATAHWEKSRQIVERVIVTGNLVLLTPTHLGGGETVGPTDMTLIRDEVSGQPLLTGASIAGALRNYLREVTHGYNGKPDSKSPVVFLFGGERGDNEGSQSLLIVDDALGQNAQVEIRDGVSIEPTTGTAKDNAKFDMELLSAGTTFPLRFELLIPSGKGEPLKKALARALQGFSRGEIMLGARKRRGFGRCRVEKWHITSYDLTTPDGLVAWLNQDTGRPTALPQVAADDHRDRFTVEATLRLDAPLLIRSEADGAEMGADAAHLRSEADGAEMGADAAHLRSIRNGERVPVLPGTSLAGVLRHRALRIINTLAPGKDGASLVRQLFGGQEDETLTASRLIVHEAVIEKGQTMVQARVKIDRFTGGAYPAALFSEAPLFGQPQVKIEMELRRPQEWEIGLLLLLLKDLWTGDLPVGGERSVGRGRLRGLGATLRRYGNDSPTAQWTLTETDDTLQVDGARERLEKYVQALTEVLK